MESPVRKIFDKINKLRTVSLSALKKISARVEMVLMETDVIQIDRYTRSDIREKLHQIKNCSTLIELREYENGEVRFHNANFCKNAIVCPVCAARVSNRRRAIYLPAVERAVERYVVPEEIRKEKGFPEGYTGAYLCTATIRPGTNLKERIDFLQESIKRMRKMGQKRERGCSGGEWSKIKAALENVEIKIGSGSGQWHVHAHFLVFTDSPLDTEFWERPYYIEIDDKDNPGQKKQITLNKVAYEWYLSTQMEAFIFDVKEIQYKESVGEIKCESFSQSIMMQSAEVFKYNTKLTEDENLNGLSDWQYIELIQRRGGRRLFNAIGEFRCDHRNERSLMTISEREVRRQEYVDKYSEFTYNIYSSEYRKDLFGYTPLQPENEAVFKNSDDMMSKFKDLRKYAFNSVHAKMTAEYRKTRSNEFKTIRSMNPEGMARTGAYHYDDIKENFENYIDGIKENYRRNVREFWYDFNNENVEVHIYSDAKIFNKLTNSLYTDKDKKFLVLKKTVSHVAPEEKKENQENFRDYLYEMRKELKGMEFPDKQILATNMTPEEIKLHQSNSPDKYLIV